MNIDKKATVKSFLARKQVCSQLNISRSTLWRIEQRDPTFPQPVNLGIKKEQWVLDELLAWAHSTRPDVRSSAHNLIRH